MPYTRRRLFVVAYALIATERFNKTLVALAGATAMFFLPIINSDEGLLLPRHRGSTGTSSSCSWG